MGRCPYEEIDDAFRMIPAANSRDRRAAIGGCRRRY